MRITSFGYLVLGMGFIFLMLLTWRTRGGVAWISGSLALICLMCAIQEARRER